MNYNNIQFYNVNILRGLPNWDILSGASVSGDKIVINSGGYAGYTLNNNYSPNSLTAALYRALSLSVSVDTDLLSNYQNYVEVVLKGVYIDNSNNQQNFYYSINVNPLKGSVAGNNLTIARVIGMENMNMTSCVIYVINHSSESVTLNSCSMLRSQDVSSSQVGESIGYAVTLAKVIDHPNGGELFYNGIDTSDKLFWIVDENDVFIGINVNNSLRIVYEKSEEIMTM